MVNNLSKAVASYGFSIKEEKPTEIPKSSFPFARKSKNHAGIAKNKLIIFQCSLELLLMIILTT